MANLNKLLVVLKSNKSLCLGEMRAMAELAGSTTIRHSFDGFGNSRFHVESPLTCAQLEAVLDSSKFGAVYAIVQRDSSAE